MEKEQARWMYETMTKIREFESEIHRIFATGAIPGFVHLSLGQEAVAAGVCGQLRETDYITSNHRGHGHTLAKGADVNAMMAEILGKETGLCKGKGGSMHIADIEKGILGANGIVGGGLPLAIGAGLRNQVLKTDDVVVCFFGDGAANQGAFHESLNMASIWKLPVIFVCENNQFGEGTPMKYASASETIAERAVAYNIPSKLVDGKNLELVYESASEAIGRARKGEGPTLIEYYVYRDLGHFEGDMQKYKAKEGPEKELADRNPTTEFKEVALEKGYFTAVEAAEIEKESKALIAAAVKFAEESEMPRPESLYEDVIVK